MLGNSEEFNLQHFIEQITEWQRQYGFKGLRLGQVIKILEKEDQDKVVRYGWRKGSAHSYRGYYSELAFEIEEDCTVKEMLGEAKQAVGREYHGYKGGLFLMKKETRCNIAPYGDCGDELTESKLRAMLDGKGPRKY